MNNPIIFLDVDGVLNCQLFYDTYDHKSCTAEAGTIEYRCSQICKERIRWLNTLCEEIDAVVVLSASCRTDMTLEEINDMFRMCGGTFTVIDKTGYTGYERGTEISKWLKDNISPDTHGCDSFDFYRYAIIDDDNDMLLTQANHFFKTDQYSGLTPFICDDIRRFITGKAFRH